MRIGLSYPETPQWPKWKWVSDAVVRLGHEAVLVRTIEQLMLADRTCDVILFSQQGGGMHPGAIIKAARLGHKAWWVQWCFQANAVHTRLRGCPRLFGPDGSPNAHLLMAQAMDVVLTKEGGLIEEYRELGVPAEYFDQGCPWWMPACEHHERPEFDVLFIGNMAWPQRQRDIRSILAEGFGVAWVGQPGDALPPGCRPFPPLPAERWPEMANRAAVLLAVDARDDVWGYHSDRTWMAMGMGACVVRRQFPGMPEGMAERCLVYHDAQGLTEALRRAVGDLGLRIRLGVESRAYALTSHTYEARIESLLEMLRCRTKTPCAPPVTETVGSM